MKFRRCLVLALVAVCGGLPTSGLSQETIGETREILKQWVEARMTLGRAHADWAANKETLKASIALFEGELKRLDDQLKAVKEGEGDNQGDRQIEKELKEKQAENGNLKSAIKKIEGVLAKYESKLKAVHKKLPPPVVDKIQPLFALLPEDSADTKMTSGKRLQLIVGILKAIDEFNSGLQLVPEVRQLTEGVEIQVQTLYLGLGQAFYTDKNGNYAGVGYGAENGWRWVEKKELAETIGRAIAIYDNAQPAAFVELPIRVN